MIISFRITRNVSEKYLLDFPKNQYLRGLKKTEKELLSLPFVNPRMTLVAPPALQGPSVRTGDKKNINANKIKDAKYKNLNLVKIGYVDDCSVAVETNH